MTIIGRSEKNHQFGEPFLTRAVLPRIICFHLSLSVLVQDILEHTNELYTLLVAHKNGLKAEFAESKSYSMGHSSRE